MVDLTKLKDDITALGEKVKTLKTTSGTADNKEAIDAAVKELVEAKRLYADHNNGIGVDGKPYQEQLSKAQKKAKAKAEKGDVAAAGPEKQEKDQDSKNAQKKASKKAAKKAQKDASKDDGDGAEPVEASQPAAAVAAAPTPPPAAAATAKPSPAPTKAAPVTTALPTPTHTTGAMVVRVSPGQIVVNPNAPLTERPVCAVAVAVLTNTILDWTLVSDHRSRHAVLCDPRGGGVTVVTGDRAMARHLARDTALWPKDDAASRAAVDSWMDYAASLSVLDSTRMVQAIAMTLHHALAPQQQPQQSYLVGHALTLADLALFGVLGFPTQVEDLQRVLETLPEHASVARRWITMMAAHPGLQEATQLCLGAKKNAEGVFDASRPRMEPLVSGMNALEGAVAGRVVTRFPPEPSGYLHIGHAKAVLLNDYYARRYQGRLILRFDDTNPSKEKEEYQESIVVDLAKLEVKPDMVTYTSDYFEVMLGYAKQLMQQGLAYMDDTPQEQMKVERENRVDSKRRNQTPEEALQFFELMCSGSPEGASFCLRAKIDMTLDNGTMRDPVLYRQNLTPHHRSGSTYKAYPTYDLACPIVDSLEGVTHALRTTEYDARNEQYQWILQALGLRRPRNQNFSRVNFEATLLSKRKLTWFVDNGYVTGWDDPRFPTVRGVVRRGIDIAALREFMYSQGASKNVVNMVWHTFFANNKKEIDGKAKRYMAIDKEKHTKLMITNGPKESDFAFKETTFHPKDPDMGSRVMRLSDTVLLENVDVEGIEVGEDIVLLRWGVVKISKVTDGLLEGEYIPDGDFRKAKRKLSWIAQVKNNCPAILYEYDHLITKAKIEEGENFEDYINPTTMATTDVIGDAGLVTLKEHEIIQLERRGFYRVDKPYMGQGKPLQLITIPDGRSKTMGGLAGKLAHH
ncbi:hypothetical protein ACA910_021812 [Epithemia clementina (nom. ined.)]